MDTIDHKDTLMTSHKVILLHVSLWYQDDLLNAFMESFCFLNMRKLKYLTKQTKFPAHNYAMGVIAITGTETRRENKKGITNKNKKRM